MPTNQALQVFYGTLPLILVLVGIRLREQMLLKDILDRLAALAADVRGLTQAVHKVESRLVVLETRAGVIYRE